MLSGIIDSIVQTPYYPEFARYNTYGIKAVNQSVYDFMKMAFYMPGSGCQDYNLYCVSRNKEWKAGQVNCEVRLKPSRQNKISALRS